MTKEQQMILDISKEIIAMQETMLAMLMDMKAAGIQETGCTRAKILQIQLKRDFRSLHGTALNAQYIIDHPEKVFSEQLETEFQSGEYEPD